MHAEIARQPLLRVYLMLKRIRLRRLDPLEVFVHDLAKVVVLNPADGSCSVLEASPEVADRARYVMCSQVAWYTFAFAWGGDTTEVSGMYLDRHFVKRGTHPFFSIQSAVSSESFNTPELKSLPRVARFWWRKRARNSTSFSTGHHVQQRDHESETIGQQAGQQSAVHDNGGGIGAQQRREHQPVAFRDAVKRVQDNAQQKGEHEQSNVAKVGVGIGPEVCIRPVPMGYMEPITAGMPTS